MKTIKYFALLLAISASLSSCLVRMNHGEHRGEHRGDRDHHDTEHHDNDRH
ncbi:MAG: hypothetical protein ACXVAY_16420 [Mucilaginibacter sp.]